MQVRQGSSLRFVQPFSQATQCLFSGSSHVSFSVSVTGGIFHRLEFQNFLILNNFNVAT
jgi:hypothetical protein